MSPAKPKKTVPNKSAAAEAAAKPSPAKARAAARAAEIETLRFEIESAWERRATLTPEEIEGATKPAVDRVIEGLEKGDLRVAEPDGKGGWQVNEWLKKAVLLYFRTQEMELVESYPAPFWDKVPARFADFDEADFRKLGARVVPGAVVRAGSHIGKDVVLMPSFVNIGAFVGEACSGSSTPPMPAPPDRWQPLPICAQEPTVAQVSTIVPSPT